MYYAYINLKFANYHVFFTKYGTIYKQQSFYLFLLYL